MTTDTATRTSAEATPAPAPAEGRRFRVGFWVAIVLVGVLLAALTALVQGTDPDAPRALDPTSTTASGSAALVRVLEQRGTAVSVTDTVDGVGGIDGGTVFIDDADGALDPAVAERIARTARHVVVVGTSGAGLEALGLRVDPAVQVDGDATVSTASCGIPAAASAARVTTAGSGYTVHDEAAARCAPTGDRGSRVWGLVRTATPGGDVTLLGTTSAFRNDTITTAGNAALALGLLGADERLVWYTPAVGTPDAAPTLGELAPPWVPSALALLTLVAVAAGVWRGRRLGPLVVERLPVVVRAAETTEGRARMYARTRDRTHALDTLRVAAVRRIGRMLGLPRSAHVDEVVRAAAQATGIPHTRVGAVLVGGTTDDDRALVDGTAALDDLERAVRRATSGDRPTSDPDRPGARP
ncbi:MULTISPECIES: DUF4350 domain-containing protein [unclassified Curtobacterium]|uniref:DUF4350 domain-containing protein n=1 Tax=unclassified Curtobacterium TaxID=257496 RepID=UPI000D8B3CBB|nr:MULTISPECIES: DUF4350 domain-containing protein [unclassified Curtobacterium]PYY63884.1 DUF4350 domain-containing protein [Curtobacterium sp. MCPF17_003]PZF29525.1 DUF4350 domain-containing protein [Curtobacterium sp. MCPF17_051]WIB69647.1 DUF4350 domain-containing protein [Curtobacterium sp. MCBD17_026]